MPIKMENELGKIELSEDVLAAIAGVATIECYGVVGMAHKRGKDGLVELLKGEHLGKGVKISIVENEIVAELFIVLGYGVNISTVAGNIIDKVKYTLETLTGFRVRKVIINVQDIRVS